MSRRTGAAVSSVVCGALAFGTCGAALATAHGDSPHPAEAGAAKAAAPVPGAEALTGQTKLLGGLGSVLQPVTDLVDAVLKSPGGKLPTPEAAKHAEAVKEALTKITAATAKKPELPKAPELPKVPEASAPPVDPTNAKAPEAPAAPQGAPSGGRQAAPHPELVAKAVTDLQAKVNALLKATSSGSPAEIATALKTTLTATVNVATSILVSGGLPAPDLPGLPKTPGLPT
ncbi:hypothetical protein ACFU99_43185 [Streptomyces sp. NPDC057654]|uniref:hypothetical protein n=1 Tax=Streptomyces sp. NPDC057654 TaxID=3346196 RepID=UPI00369F3A2E